MILVTLTDSTPAPKPIQPDGFVSLEIQLPTHVYERLKQHLTAHEHQDQDALFLQGLNLVLPPSKKPANSFLQATQRLLTLLQPLF